MKKIFLLFALCISLTNVNAQGFYTIARTVDSVYANDTEEDGPKINIERIMKRWDGQFDKNGSFSTAAANFYNYSKSAYGANKTQSGTCSGYTPTWKEIGPAMDGTNSGSLVGAGLIHRLTFHPQYDGLVGGNQTIFAMSGFGGIWRTDNDGDNWVRIKTDPYIPFSSVGDLVIDPTNPLRMYVTTGAPGGGLDLIPYITMQRDFPNFTLGIYGTDDGGNTWTQVTTTTNGIDAGLFNGGTTYNLKLDPQNHDNLIFTSTDGVYYSTNASGALSSINWTKEAQFSTTPGNFGLSNGDDQLVGLTFNPTTHEWFASGLQIYSSPNPFTGGNWNISSNPSSGLDLTTANFPGTSDAIKRINIVNSPLTGAGVGSTSDQTNAIFALIYAGTDKIGIAKKTGTGNWDIIHYMTAYGFAAYGRSIDKQAIIATPGSGTAPTNSTNFYVGNNSYYAYNSSTNILSQCYPNIVGLHADIQSLTIHPSQPNKLWITSDGGISLKLLNVGIYNNGVSFKNNGIQAQLLWQCDDSELDNDYFLAALQDNGGQFIDDTYSNNKWKTSYFQGDGFKSQIFDKDAKDGFIDGSSFGPKAFNYSTGAIVSFSGGGGSYYFSDPEHPAEKVLVGDTQLKTTHGNGTSWDQSDVPNIPSVVLGYIPKLYSYASGGGRKPLYKVAYPNYIGSPLTVYAITKRTGYQEVSDPNPRPSFLLKSTNGFNSQWNSSGNLDNYFSNVSQITNALYTAAKAASAISATDLPQLSGVTCQPEDGNKLWVCSSGLLPNFKV